MKKAEYKKEIHNIEPYFDKNSKILILGSFPSIKSRNTNFYYGHPKNRFWIVLAKLFNSNIPLTVVEKKELLTKNKIALWDVIATCKIRGSSDVSIQDVVINDINIILKNSTVNNIYINGKKAFDLYNKYVYPIVLKRAICLPSTSPANANYTVDRLIEDWKIILEDENYK